MLLRPLANQRLLSPFLALRDFQAEFERLLGAPGAERPDTMAFAFYTREDDLLLRTPLPGVDPAGLGLEVVGDVLTLSGRFADEPAETGILAQHVERPRGAFRRSLRLPFEIDAARVSAKLERGVLEVVLPRLVKNPPVKIQVLSENQTN